MRNLLADSGKEQIGTKGAVQEVIKQGGRAAVFYLLAFFLLLTGCGGGGEGGVSSQVVSGVAATGSPIAGQVRIKDSSTVTREGATVIANDGSFALDVTGMKAPFILQATGSANGRRHSLHSFADGPGTANINPLSDAAVANAAGVSDPAQVYENPEPATLRKIRDNLSNTITEIQNALKPLMSNFGSDKVNPIRDKYRADHTGIDNMFDNVQITIIDGIITVTNLKTGAVIYTGPISDMRRSHFTENDDDVPNPGAIPTAPVGITATGGAAQTTVTWGSVGNATSYNLYWSTSTGVTTTNGTKVSGATTPYVNTGLSADTTYYYIVTAVNSAGESAASAETSATTTVAPPPTPTSPAAPTGVTATGGTNQVTIAWANVSGATSYNLYWSTTNGFTKASGTQITGATSPTVQNGLADGATYYYFVTAVNSAGEGAASVQVVATTLTPAPTLTIPTAPTGVTAAGGAKQVTLTWPAVTGATSYNVYWSSTLGGAAAGTKLAGVSSPFVHTPLSDGSTYYYVVTAANSVGESAASAEVNATTNPAAPTAPTAPTGVTATGGNKQVTISWLSVTGAISYNIYWSTTTGVTTAGTKITGAASPYAHTGLADSTGYFYIVTAVNGVGEGIASAQTTATTNAPATPTLCVSCHGTPPATGRHAFHFPSRTNTCVTCHGTGYDPYGLLSALPSTHSNGVINIASGNPPGWNSTNRTCTNTCHGTRAW
ncbi:MAG: fibronectin type III domain-containing protein [Syntrophales bacterium]